MHDSTVGIDGSSNDFILVFEVDNYYRRFGSVIKLFAYTDVMIGLERLPGGSVQLRRSQREETTYTGVEADRRRLHTISQLGS